MSLAAGLSVVRRRKFPQHCLYVCVGDGCMRLVTALALVRQAVLDQCNEDLSPTRAHRSPQAMYRNVAASMIETLV